MVSFNRKDSTGVETGTDNTIQRWRSIKILCRHGLPTAISFAATTLSNAIAFAFIGKQANAITEAAHGLGYSIGNILVIMIGLGLLNGMDTLCPLAIGSGHPEKCWAHLYQGIAIVSLTLPFLLPLIFFSSNILIRLGQNVEVSVLAQEYLIAGLPGLFCVCIFEALRKFLIFHRYQIFQTSIALITIPVQIGFLYVFVVWLSLGAFGAGLARSATWSTISAGLSAYVFWRRNDFGWRDYMRSDSEEFTDKPVPPLCIFNSILETENDIVCNEILVEDKKNKISTNSVASSPPTTILSIAMDTPSLKNQYNIETSVKTERTEVCLELTILPIPLSNTNLENCNTTQSAELSNTVVFVNTEENDTNAGSNIASLNKGIENSFKGKKELSFSSVDIKKKNNSLVILTSPDMQDISSDNQTICLNPIIQESSVSTSETYSGQLQQIQQLNSEQSEPKNIYIFHWWHGLWHFLQTAFPSTLMCAFEWISFEIQILLASYLGPEELAAISVAASVGTLIFMLSFGVGLTVNSEVGRAMGNQRPNDARTLACAGPMVSLFVISPISLALVLNRKFIARIYSATSSIQKIIALNLIPLGLVLVFDSLHVILGGVIKALSLQHIGCVFDAIGLLVIMQVSGGFLAFHTPLAGRGFLIGTCIGLTIVNGCYSILLFKCINWKRRSVYLKEKREKISKHYKTSFLLHTKCSNISPWKKLKNSLLCFHRTTEI